MDHPKSDSGRIALSAPKKSGVVPGNATILPRSRQMYSISQHRRDSNHVSFPQLRSLNAGNADGERDRIRTTPRSREVKTTMRRNTTMQPRGPSRSKSEAGDNSDPSLAADNVSSFKGKSAKDHIRRMSISLTNGLSGIFKRKESGIFAPENEFYNLQSDNNRSHNNRRNSNKPALSLSNNGSGRGRSVSISEECPQVQEADPSEPDPNRNRRRSSIRDLLTLREPGKAMQFKDRTIKISDLDWARRNGVAYLQGKIESPDYFRMILAKFDRAHLTRVYAGDNQLPELPEEIFTFTNIDVLACENNRIHTIPTAFCRLKKIRVLYLNDNILKQGSFPQHFNELTHLTVLWLQGNRLKMIPNELCYLTNLRYLNAGSNRIKSVSPSFSNLRRLKSLWLNDNLLETIPAEIGRLMELETLDVENNHIAAVPESIEALPKLKVFKANGNNISSRTLRRMSTCMGSAGAEGKQGKGGEAYSRLQKYYQARLTQTRDTNRLFMNVICQTQYQTPDFKTGWSIDK